MNVLCQQITQPNYVEPVVIIHFVKLNVTFLFSVKCITRLVHLC